MDSDQLSGTLLKAIDFQLDNADAVNDRFVQWRLIGTANDGEWVQTWVYCWTRRYFFRKFLCGQIHSAGDTEKLIEEVYFLFIQKHAHVHTPSHFAAWLSVICKYRFLNYIRSCHPEHWNEALTEVVGNEADKSIVHDLDVKLFFDRIISGEMRQLPDYVQTDIHKKIWEDKEYHVIAQEMGYSVETIRAYFARGIKALRNSHTIREAYAESYEPNP